MREGSKYCEKCGKFTPPTPGKTRVCYVCDSLYSPSIAPGRPLKTKRKVKGKRPVKAAGKKKASGKK